MSSRFEVTFLKIYIFVILLYKSSQVSEDGGINGEPNIPDDPSVKLLNERLTKLVNSWDFELKTYDVFTNDGYGLKLHRLTKKGDNLKTKSPFLIMHGLRECGAMFVSNRNSLAYYMAEREFDVWVGNARGTAFSMKHKNLKPSQRKFWDYTFHEIGYYDVPAIIDKITQETGVDHVHYVGYSMGTTVFLAMAATQTNTVRDKVASVTLVAPVACPMHYKKIDNKAKRLITKVALKTFGTVFRGDIYTLHPNVAWVTYKMCKSKLLGFFCEAFLRFWSEGPDIFDHVTSLETLPFFPCGASVKTYLHFIQLAEAKKFQQYNYGRRKNQLKYKQPEPLAYDLDAIDKEMYLLVGGHDSKADKRDIQWMHKKLKNSFYVTEKLEHFDHRDFQFSTKLHTSNEVIMEIIEAHNEGRKPKLTLKKDN